MRALTSCLVVASLSLACALGFRGGVAFEATYSLTDVDAVRLRLPDTPLSVLGDPAGDALLLDGVWFSVGGSEKVATDNATAARLEFAREGRFAELSAIIPISERDLVDLEVHEVTLPADRDLEIWTGVGDVEVAQVEGNISIDIDAGHVAVFGGADGIAVRTGAGDLDIVTSGNTDAHTGRGDVDVAQSGVGSNDLIITTDHGNIEATLRGDANLDLEIVAAGNIRVQTRTVSTVTSGRFNREVGNGSVKIWLKAPGGEVSVRLDESI